VEPAVAHEIDMPAEDRPECLLQMDHVEEVGAVGRLDEQVDVGVRAVLFASRRTEAREGGEPPALSELAEDRSAGDEEVMREGAVGALRGDLIADRRLGDSK